MLKRSILQRQVLAIVAAGLVFTVTISAPVAATSASISHAYYSPATIKTGSLVSLEPGHPNTVQAATSGNNQSLIGVIVNPNNSLLAIDATSNTVQVVTSGSVNILVSTVGGNISVGDKIAASGFAGVGMKASGGEKIIGVAQTAFSPDSPGATTEPITNTTGQTKQVSIGYVRLAIAIGTDSSIGSTPKLTNLQRLVQSLTGHVIPTSRIVVALVLGIITLLSLIIMIYGSIYGSIISIGRNPLSKNTILQALRSVLGLAVLTAAVASLIIFLLLR